MADTNNNLAAKALSRIRRVAKGNGVPMKSIHIIKDNSETIVCEAITHIDLEHDIKEERRNGAHQIGELIEDPTALPAMIEKVAADAIKNSAMRTALTNVLLERPDKGFSIHAEYFNVDTLNKDYCVHQPCNTCQGQAQVACRSCNGQKMEQCNQCHGRTAINCNFCHGGGFIKGPKGDQIQCNRCFGKRQIKCPLCRSQGKIPCRGCKGAGSAKCNDCAGLGVFTFITHVMYKMKTLFEIDRASIPHPAVKVIEDDGGKLVEDEHIKIKGEAVKREDDGLAIKYKVQFPYADLDIGVGGNPVKIHMFGYKGKMLKITNFLDQIIEKDYALLLRAANNQGNVVGHIRKASKTKMIGDGLILSVTMRPKKAMMALKKTFPYGASNEIIKDIIVQSNKALINISRKNHLSGLGIGLIMAALINAIYFLGPLRGVMISGLGQGGVLSMVDFSLIPLGGFITMMISKFMAASPLKKALGPLMPAKQRASFKPRNNNSSIPAFIASAVVFLIITFIATTMDAPTPTWLPF